MSPTSSRKSVPRSASSKRPIFWLMAPVNAPFSWPKSSDSMRPDGMAAQLIFTKVRSRRGLRLWMARAKSSLPVPVSPSSSTVVAAGAASSTWPRARLSAALSPTISSKLISLRISSEVELFDRQLVLQRVDFLERECVFDGDGDLRADWLKQFHVRWSKSVEAAAGKVQSPKGAVAMDERHGANRLQTFGAKNAHDFTGVMVELRAARKAWLSGGDGAAGGRVF